MTVMLLKGPGQNQSSPSSASATATVDQTLRRGRPHPGQGRSSAVHGLLLPGQLSLARPHPVQTAQIDEHIGQRVLVGDRSLVAQLGPLDTQLQRLAVDPLIGRALLVDQLVGVAPAIQLVADALASPLSKVWVNSASTNSPHASTLVATTPEA